jgi:hypothetical protein
MAAMNRTCLGILTAACLLAPEAQAQTATPPPGAYPQQPPGAYPQQPPGAYPQQPPGAYPQQPPGAYPQQPPGAYPQQPPGAYPQQPGAYPPPPAGYGYYPPQPTQMPEYLPYKDGYASPAGYHLEEGPSTGLVVAGAVTLAIPYVIGVSFVAPAGFPNQSIWLLVPVLGPWMSMGARRSTCTLSHDATLCGLADTGALMMYMMDGILQATGATLLIVGVSTTRRRYVRDDVVSLLVTPMPVGSGYGLGVFGRL